MVKRVISMVSYKGGTGKTACAVNLAGTLVKIGYKVALLDFDPQSDATKSLGLKENQENNSHDFINGKADLKTLFRETHGIHLIPSGRSLSRAEKENTDSLSTYTLLKRAISDLNGFDFILIDCYGGLGFLTRNALVASDYVILPVQTESLAISNVPPTVELINSVREALNPDIKVLGFLRTMYDQRNKSHREAQWSLVREYGDQTFETIIRRNIDISDASAQGEHIHKFAPRSNGSHDFFKLAEEVVERIKNNG